MPHRQIILVSKSVRQVMVSSAWAADKVMRKRDVPFGIVGGRIAPTCSCIMVRLPTRYIAGQDFIVCHLSLC